MTDFIQIYGKKYPIRISYYALKVVSNETGAQLQDILKKDITVLEPLLFSALQAGQYAHNKMNPENPLKHEFERKEMEFLLDECMVEFTAVMNNSFVRMAEAKMKVDGREKDLPKALKRQ